MFQLAIIPFLWPFIATNYRQDVYIAGVPADGKSRDSFDMKAIPEVLVLAFSRTLKQKAIEQNLAGDYLKWLRYYLDFCLK